MWHIVWYNGVGLEGDLPPDGKWLWWKDKNGTVTRARMKLDIEDHFYPSALIKAEDVIAWRDDEDGK